MVFDDDGKSPSNPIPPSSIISSYLVSPLDEYDDNENSPPMMPDSPNPPIPPPAWSIPAAPHPDDDEFEDEFDEERAPISRLLAACIDIAIATYSQDSSPDRKDTALAGPACVPNTHDEEDDDTFETQSDMPSH